MLTITFRPQFREALLDGRKTATSRTKLLGNPGDRFRAFGATFILQDVRLVTLGLVARERWREEGARSQDDFKRIWASIHPRIGFRETYLVYLYTFTKASPKGTGR